MYPVLLDMFLEETSENKELFENNKKMLKYVIENFTDFTALNGELYGQTVSTAIRTFGKEALGENGMVTEIFKNGGSTVFSLLDGTDETEQDTTIYPFGVVKNILATDIFTADKVELNGKAGIYEEKSFMLLIMLSGEGTVSDYDSSFKIKKGSLVFIPAKMRLELMGNGELIIAHV